MLLTRKKWIVLTDEAGEPRCVLDAHAFLRGVLFGGDDFDAWLACHRPLVVREGTRTLGRVMDRLTVRPEGPGDDVIDEDMILVWAPWDRRIITGSDILGRLLRGIAHNPGIPEASVRAERPAAPPGSPPSSGPGNESA